MKSPNTQAGRSVQLSPLQQWLTEHGRALFSCIGSITKRPLSNLMAIIIIGIAIALPSGLQLFLSNIQTMTQQFHTQPTLSLYLAPNTSQQDSLSLIQTINRYQQVKKTTFISSKEGLKTFGEQTHLTSVLNELPKNPLPAIIEVIPKASQQSPNALKALQSQLQKLPGVTLAQLDTQWVFRLHQLITIGNRVTKILTVLFYLAVILIVGNTIRMAAQMYQRESQIQHLFGASRAMIRRPLLYRGAALGLCGGLLALMIIELSMLYIKGPASALAHSYQSTLLTTHIPLSTSITIILSGAGLGWLGARLAAKQHLKVQ